MGKVRRKAVRAQRKQNESEANIHIHEIHSSACSVLNLNSEQPFLKKAIRHDN